MKNDGYSVYRYWLRRDKEKRAETDKQRVTETINTSILESPSYQSGALRNGESQPIAAIRTDTNKCKITVIPGDEMCIGDLITVFNERWLVMELYTDEYGVTYGEIWMCNHKFVYQDFDGKVIVKDSIIDDGSYSKGSDKQISVVDGTYRCYMSLDDESAVLFVDKRLAIDVIMNQNGDPILEVGKIRWIDTKTKNYGEGSHLLFFTLSEDVYNQENDSIENLICDYKSNEEEKVDNQETPAESIGSCLVINGRDSIRIGTSRTYKAIAVDEKGNSVGAENVVWDIEGNDLITIKGDNETCIVSVPLNESLVGKDFTIICRSESEKYKAANKQVAVISIG